MSMTEFIIAIIVAIFGSNGVWMFLVRVFDKKSSIKDDMEDINKTIKEIQTKLGNLEELGHKNNDLAKATARDRLNFLNHKYREQGYIPSNDLVAYKLIGEAYSKADGNTIIQEEFDLCMKELPRK